MALAVGQAAPGFSLPATQTDTFALGDWRGKKNVLIIFYPKDNTPG